MISGLELELLIHSPETLKIKFEMYEGCNLSDHLSPIEHTQAYVSP